MVTQTKSIDTSTYIKLDSKQGKSTIESTNG